MQSTFLCFVFLTEIYDNAGLPEVPDTTYTPLLQSKLPGEQSSIYTPLSSKLPDHFTATNSFRPASSMWINASLQTLNLASNSSGVACGLYPLQLPQLYAYMLR